MGGHYNSPVIRTETEELFRAAGGPIFRRAARLLDDEGAAARATLPLFVRMTVHGRGVARAGAEARWTWIYRAVTAYCLQRLGDDQRLGGAGAGGPASPTGRDLARLDEVARAAVVLSVVDGLGEGEIAEVLGIEAADVARKLAAAGAGGAAGAGAAAGGAASAGDGHPSALALDRDPVGTAAHVAGCARCRERATVEERRQTLFEREIAPAAVARVVGAVAGERARLHTGPRWARLAWLAGATLGAAALALLVARPHRPAPGAAPYVGTKGASRARAAGIEISFRRGEELRAIDPAVVLRPGDRLQFRVRAEGPRFLALRAGDRVIFPAVGVQAALVRPGQALDADYVVAPGAAGQRSGKLAIVGLFADHPFPLDRAPGPDVEVAAARIAVAE